MPGRRWPVEVEYQAFIDTRLGPCEPRSSWQGKKDLKQDRQGCWKRGNLNQVIEKDPDAMEVNVARVQNPGEPVDCG
jgi:hypothetical protein